MVPQNTSILKAESEGWLDDKGAWPIIGIIGGAGMFCAFWSFSTLVTNPDVRIRKFNRSKIIRDWEVKRN